MAARASPTARSTGLVSTAARAWPRHTAASADGIVSSGDADRLSEALVGGKARNLGRLVELGFPVPPWFCITTRVYEGALGDLEEEFAATLAGLDFSDPAAVRAAAARIQGEIRARSLSRRDERELLARFDATFEAGSRVAVRS